MKIKPENYLHIFFLGGVLLLLIIWGLDIWVMPHDSEGWMSDKDAILLLFGYPIPLQIINYFIYKSLFIKTYKHQVWSIKKYHKLLIPLIWWPMSFVYYFGIYWIKTGQLIETEDGSIIDPNQTN